MLALLGCLGACDRPPPPSLGAAGSRKPGDYAGLADDLVDPSFIDAKTLQARCAKKEQIKVLIWGQSISEQFPADALATYLTSQWPGCQFEVENRSRGGCAAQCLTGDEPWTVKKAPPTAYFDVDVRPFSPDYVIFHVYGSHRAYGALMEAMKTATHARVLMLTDHVLAAQGDGEDWSETMASEHLPDIAKEYGFTLADSRLVWRRYLHQTGLGADELLTDGLHLNDKGVELYMYVIERFMAARKAS